jgi:hypothetical protein
MLRTLNPAADIPLPEWSQNLVSYYWHIRVEGRNQAKRRRYYRLVSKEKLRLVEQYKIDQYVLNYLCRYLSNLKPNALRNLELMINNSDIQMKLELY